MKKKLFYVIGLVIVGLGIVYAPRATSQSPPGKSPADQRPSTSGKSLTEPAGSVIPVTGGPGGAVGSGQGKITIKPDRLIVAAAPGSSDTRIVLLSTSSTPVTGMRIIPLDLARGDGSAVLHATAIQPDALPNPVKANDLITVRIKFDLGNAQSGEYTGDLLLSYDNSAPLAIPVTVRVKDGWLGPLVLLLFGLAVGMALSYYRDQGRPRDETLVRDAQLRAQMLADSGLAETFKLRIDGFLMDAQTLLQAQNWTEARQATEHAEAVWNKWRKWRDDWLIQLKHGEQLAQRLRENDLNQEAHYILTVRGGLEDALRQAPDMQEPHELQGRLDTLGQQINDYLRLKGQLAELNRLIGNLADGQAQARLVAKGFAESLDDLQPTDDRSGYQQLKGSVDAEIANVTPRVAPPSENPAAKGVRQFEGRMLGLLPRPPSVRPAPGGAQSNNARTQLRLHIMLTDPANRLAAFKYVSYAIALGLLAGAGFSELYVSRPLFGAWSDYFALFAWGFGAEAARASVAGVVKSWGLPGLR